MSNSIDRRDFLKTTAALAAGTVVGGSLLSDHVLASELAATGDSLCLGPGWETLNPGFWQIKDKVLRRRVRNYGDRARATGFPFHYETHQRNDGKMPVDYDPSLPAGIVYRKEWKLSGKWSLSVKFTYHGNVDVKREGDSDDWKMFQPGYSMMGVAFGAKSLFESYTKVRNAMLVGWTDNGKFGFAKKPGGRNRGGRPAKLIDAPQLKVGDKVEITVRAEPNGDQTKLTAEMKGPDGKTISVSQTVGTRATEGYIGVVGRGLADFAVDDVARGLQSAGRQTAERRRGRLLLVLSAGRHVEVGQRQVAGSFRRLVRDRRQEV